MLYEIAVITVGSFLASLVNGMFATGGVYLLIIASSSVLPLTVAVPLQSAFTMGSLLARLVLFLRFLNWQIATAFILGSGVGVYCGTGVFVTLDEAQISLLLGAVLLTVTWFPKLKRNIRLRHQFLIVGVIHSFLGTLFGVGAVLQPAILRTSLLKASVTATLAACLFSMDLLKIIGYISIGFDYLSYKYHIIFATIAGFIGTWVGKCFTHQISETLFRRVFFGLVTVVALRMLYKGFTSLMYSAS